VIAVSRDSGERWHCLPIPTKEGRRGQKCCFHNSIIGNFMIYQDRIDTNFLVSFIIFEVNIVVEQ